MKLFLRPNLKKEESAQCTRVVVEELLRLGLVPMVENRIGQHLGLQNCVTGELPDLMEQCEVLVPIGGDGTLMRCAADAVRADKPILGINAGRIGFLTQLETCEISQLGRLKDGQYRMTERMMLEGVVVDETGAEKQRFIALNDIVATRGEMNSVADVEVFQGERLITRQRGDGMIFATPTGSTAYSLSAGGPVVDPELEVVLLTAICPHATFRCTMTLPGWHTYTLREAVVNRSQDLMIAADGRRVITIAAKECLMVRKHGKKAKLIDLGLHDFYESLNEKLSWRR